MQVRSISAATALCFILTTAMPAQTPQSTPTPSPQQQMMGYFAGDWKLSGTAKISPNGPGAPYTATERGEWLPGGFFLETHIISHGPLGDVHATRMMEYNSLQKVFTYNAYNSLGEHIMAEGNVQGKTWIWNAVKKLNGVITKGRYTVTFLSPDSYSFKSEVPKTSGGWATIMEGTATRAH